MIVLNVTYKCKAGMREKFLEAVKAEGIDAASRAEEGNIRYDYFLADADPDELFLLEHWRDEEALALHHDMPHFKRLGEIKACYVDDTLYGRFSD